MPLILKPQTENLLLQENYTDFKIRRFNENFEAIQILRKTHPAEFVNVTLKKMEGLILQILVGGIKSIELFNEEIHYLQDNKFTRFVQTNIQ
jgi:hypothetical protein